MFQDGLGTFQRFIPARPRFVTRDEQQFAADVAFGGVWANFCPPRVFPGGGGDLQPRCLEALTRKERVAVAALVELVWGAATFTGEGVPPKVSAASYSKE